MSDTCKHGAEWEYFEIFDAAGNPLETDRRLCMSCRAESAEAERDELLAKVKRLEHIAQEARGQLGAALMQTISIDDQIIMDHVRTAYRLIGGKEY
jgi:hypothetical protein